MPRKDYFHAYIAYCETERPLSPGDYLEQVAHTDRVSDHVRLVRDLIDTFHAGHLLKFHLTNGGAYYVWTRKTLCGGRRSHIKHTGG